jgi:hypothetical protein
VPGRPPRHKPLSKKELAKVIVAVVTRMAEEVESECDTEGSV